MSAHYALSPSAASRWFNCPGSIRLSVGRESTKTIHAANGTLAHEVAEDLLRGLTTVELLRKRVGEQVDVEGFACTITDEMVDGAILYKHTIVADYARFNPYSKPQPIVGRIETKVAVESLSPDLKGTADYYQFRKGDFLIVYDYKFGKSAVDPEENEQESIYALGAMETEGIAPNSLDHLELVIVQPRAGGVKRWVVPGARLGGFREGLSDAVRATQSPTAPVKEGRYCYFCPAASVCPLKEGARTSSAEEDFGPMVDNSSCLPENDPLGLDALTAPVGVAKTTTAPELTAEQEAILGQVNDPLASNTLGVDPFAQEFGGPGPRRPWPAADLAVTRGEDDDWRFDENPEDSSYDPGGVGSWSKDSRRKLRLNENEETTTMAKEKIKAPELVTPIFRVSWPSVFTARKVEGSDGGPKYSMTMIWRTTPNPKDPSELVVDIKPLRDLVTQAVKLYYGEDQSKWPVKTVDGKKVSALNLPLRNGLDKAEFPGYGEGTVFASCSSKMKPGLVDANRQPILEPSEFYGGCYARAKIVAFAYDTKGNIGIAFGLRNVQKWKDGTPFTGGESAADSFDSIPLPAGSAAETAGVGDPLGMP